MDDKNLEEIKGIFEAGFVSGYSSAEDMENYEESLTEAFSSFLDSYEKNY